MPEVHVADVQAVGVVQAQTESKRLLEPRSGGRVVSLQVHERTTPVTQGTNEQQAITPGTKQRLMFGINCTRPSAFPTIHQEARQSPKRPRQTLRLAELAPQHDTLFERGLSL